ncbi:hypothetical protein CCP3SC1AL1_1170013 [Gammaproteobacteria bacterium]
MTEVAVNHKLDDLILAGYARLLQAQVNDLPLCWWVILVNDQRFLNAVDSVTRAKRAEFL